MNGKRQGSEAKVTFLPDQKDVHVRAGTSLLDAARRAGVHIRTRCGGKAGCLMCKVAIEAGLEGVSKAGPAELQKLGEDAGNVRLSCQALVTGAVPIVAAVPEDPLRAAVRKQLEQQKEDDSLW